MMALLRLQGALPLLELGPDDVHAPGCISDHLRMGAAASLSEHALVWDSVGLLMHPMFCVSRLPLEGMRPRLCVSYQAYGGHAVDKL